MCVFFTGFFFFFISLSFFRKIRTTFGTCFFRMFSVLLYVYMCVFLCTGFFYFSVFFLDWDLDE